MAATLIEEIEAVAAALPRRGRRSWTMRRRRRAVAQRWVGPVRPAGGDRRARAPVAHRGRGRATAATTCRCSRCSSRASAAWSWRTRLEFYERLTGKMAIEALTPGALILSKGFRNHGASRRSPRGWSASSRRARADRWWRRCWRWSRVAIKLDSRGPVFFVQQRTGKDGRPFSLLKFRTMHPCRRPRVGVGAGQRASHHARRQLAAPLPPRRAAAAGQRAARRDEPDRARGRIRCATT